MTFRKTIIDSLLTLSRLFILIFLLVAVTVVSIKAQVNSSIPASVTNARINVDGALDEQAWEMAEPVTDFLQLEPEEGARATRNTEVRVLFGENNLYIGAVLYDDPATVEDALGRRNEYNRADWFLVSIDSYFNRRTAYTFGVSAAGVQIDGQRSASFRTPPGSDLPTGLDTSWDAIWHSAVTITDEGWIAEIGIPYNMLRFPHAENQTWGIHFTRRVAQQGEISEWPLIRRTESSNLIANFNHITNITSIEPGRNIQITPYLLSSLDIRESNPVPGQAVYRNNYDAGGDIKIGLGPNIMLDATINPDFGQVESDPAELNLTAFETFFPERRPFFIEGADIFRFSFGRSSMFYSRRIGARDPIIGSAKLSGRTAGGMSFGVLGATTGQNFNPSRNYGIGRVSQQIGNYSSVGGIITGFDNLNPAVNGPDHSLAGGADWDLRSSDNRYGISGLAVFTHRNLNTADNLKETGFANRLEFNKRQGIINGSLSLSVYSDEFNPNDLGQLRRNNYYEASSRVSYEIKGGQEFGPFQRANASVFVIQSYSYDEGLDLGDMISISSQLTTKRFQSIRLSSRMSNTFNGYDLYETRGLGPWASPFSSSFSARFTTDQRRNWQLTPDVEYGITGTGGQSYEFGIRGNWNLGNRLNLSGSISGEYENYVTAWSANETFRLEDDNWFVGKRSVHPDLLTEDDFVPLDDGEQLENILSLAEPYDTDRYYVPVFGERDTRSLDLTLRSSFSFTPVLSLQLYSQLFIAKGMYNNHKILVNPDELVRFSSYPKKSDFSYKSLLSNFVLRWEYSPGSTLYLVWSHGRRERETINPLAPYGESPYYRSTGRHVEDLFSLYPQNTFMLKLNYTFI